MKNVTRINALALYRQTQRRVHPIRAVIVRADRRSAASRRTLTGAAAN